MLLSPRLVKLTWLRMPLMVADCTGTGPVSTHTLRMAGRLEAAPSPTIRSSIAVVHSGQVEDSQEGIKRVEHKVDGLQAQLEHWHVATLCKATKNLRMWMVKDRQDGMTWKMEEHDGKRKDVTDKFSAEAISGGQRRRWADGDVKDERWRVVIHGSMENSMEQQIVRGS